MPEEVIKEEVVEEELETPEKEDKIEDELEEEPEKEPAQSAIEYEAEAKKWREKYHDQQQELQDIQSKYTQSLEKDTVKKEVKEDPELQTIGTSSFSPNDWDKVLVSKGFDVDELEKNEKVRLINQIVNEHNNKVDRETTKKELSTLKKMYAENASLSDVEKDSKEKIKEYLNVMNADSSNPEKYKQQVEMAKSLLAAEVKVDTSQIKSDSEKDKQIGLQPETISSTAKETKSEEYDWSEKEDKVRRDVYKMTKKEWAANRS